VYYVGPWNTATPLTFERDAEIIWVRLKLGVQFAKIPTVRLSNTETLLRYVSPSSVDFGSVILPIPGIREIDAFVDRIGRSGVLQLDPVIERSLDGGLPDVAPRTLRQVFLNVAGLSLERISQIRRARRAAEMLNSGISVSEVIDTLLYYDQSHLTRNLIRYVGRTPGSVAK
jgi:hypothetical protein